MQHGAVFSMMLLLAAAGCPTPAGAADAAPRLLVFEIEIDGDRSEAAGGEGTPEALARRTEALRHRLRQSSLYTVLPAEAGAERIASVRRSQYLHACNGCELDLGKAIGADYVLVPWVFRMSRLVLTLHVEIKDVASGRTVVSRALDFRGDTDAGWQRAITYFVRDLEAGRTTNR